MKLALPPADARRIVLLSGPSHYQPALLAEIDPSCLPVQYGGTDDTFNPSIDTGAWLAGDDADADADATGNGQLPADADAGAENENSPRRRPLDPCDADADTEQADLIAQEIVQTAAVARRAQSVPA